MLEKLLSLINYYTLSCSLCICVLLGVTVYELLTEKYNNYTIVLWLHELHLGDELLYIAWSQKCDACVVHV